MTGWEVRGLDRADEAWLRAYWELGERSTAEQPHAGWPAWETARVAWRHVTTERDVVLVGAVSTDAGAGRLVGGAFLGLPMLENTHAAFLELLVDTDLRRRGIGTALLAAAEERARVAGRTTVITDAVVVAGQAPAGRSFAEARGYAVASTDECKLADLGATAGLLDDLARETADTAPYVLRAWADPTPEVLLEPLAGLYGRFLDEVPMEDLDLGAQVWTPERIRAWEEERAAAGVTRLFVAAVAPDGALAGLTDLTVADARPEEARVAVTLVLPEHRGHGLGLALKTRMHRLLLEQWPQVRHVVTWNAGVNAAMNAVNERLGYRVVQHEVGLQKRL